MININGVEDKNNIGEKKVNSHEEM
jgi:hypothetical protein